MKIKRKIDAGCGFNAAVKAAKKVLKNNMSEKNVIKLTKKCIFAAKKIIGKKNSHA